MDTMNNIHPIYNIKILMTKRELMKDPALQNESWDRFLPKFKKKNVQTKKPKKQVVKKKYTPFPPPQQPSKVDLQLESGEYFMKEHERKQKKNDEKEQAQQQKTAQKRKEREAVFVAPTEESVLGEKTEEANSSGVDIEALKKKLKNKKLKSGVSVSAITNSSQNDIADNPDGAGNDVPKKKKKKKSENDDVLSQENVDVSVKPKKKKKRKVDSETSEELARENVSEKSRSENSDSGMKKRKKSKNKVADSETVVTDTSVLVKKKKLKKESS